MKITAAVVRASDQPFTLEELELDEPRDDEVLVRIIATGLCLPILACAPCRSYRSRWCWATKELA